jgi:succinylglutamate desuccinylase
MLSLGKLLELTLAGREPAEKIQVTPAGARLHWIAEGVLEVCPPTNQDAHRDLLLSAGIHGNETAPIELLDRLLQAIARGGLLPRIRVLFVLGNPEAMRRGERYVEQDLNRLFAGHHADASGFEALRAAQLEGLATQFFSRPARARLHYDLHTAIRGSKIQQFALYPYRDGRRHSREQLAWLQAAGIQAVLLQAQRGVTFSAFTYAELGAEAFTLELGKARPFGHNQGVDLSRLEASLEALVNGQTGAGDGDPDQLQLFRVSREIVKLSECFSLNLPGDVENFHELPAGYLLAEDAGRRWIVEEEGARIIFPNPRVKNGLRAGILIVPADLPTVSPDMP